MVLAGSKQNGTPSVTKITICHATGSSTNPFVVETVDASSIVDSMGNSKHPDDIVPQFTYVFEGSTAEQSFPGQNLTTTYGGYSGADWLANNCNQPTGAITSTSVSTTTVTVPTTITETELGTTVTEPAVTITKPVTVTITIPAVTVTTPGATTVVTVPSGQTTTVTLPEQTVTLPATTQTIAGQTIEHDPVTVTQPGTSTTITAGATTTVVTVTAPNKTVEGGVLGARATVVTVTGPIHTVTLPGHIVKEVVKAKALIRTIYETLIRACQPAMGSGKG
jgi:hypothetical protein